MRTFDVYRHPTEGFQAVKQGFSWPGFFFGWIWAFVKKMWGIGFGILAIIILLSIVNVAFEEEGSTGGVLLINLVFIGIAIGVGAWGNEWRRALLTKKGFKKIKTLQAASPDAAIATAVEKTANST